MLKNYFKVAFRNLWKNKFLSSLNIVGLATGLSCCLLMTLFITDELSYDKFNRDSDLMYRVVKDFVNEDGSRLPDATTPPAIAPAIMHDIPEVEMAIRVFPNWGNKYLVKYGEKKFYEEGVYRADPDVFSFFTFPLLKGNPSTALLEKNSIVLTESAAKKYFGTEDPIGKTMEITDNGSYRVTAVMKDIPGNSHFTFDFLLPIKDMERPNQNLDNIWGFYNFYTYIKLKPTGTIAGVEPKIQATFKKNQPDNDNIFYTQRLEDIHLTSHLKWELSANSDRQYIYIFGIIALFVIIIAAINYINLVTAKSSLRAKEIGIRKVVGAERISLIRQFLTESILITLLASVVAILFVKILLPLFNSITQKDLSLFSSEHYQLIMSLFLFAVLIGIAAGLYPAFYLSGFKPVLVLKSFKNAGRNSFTLRRLLVVVQFVISIVLIIGTVIVSRQLRYMQTTDLGFNKDHVLIINNSYGLPGRGSVLEDELKKIPGVIKTAGSDGMIGGQNWTNSLRVKGSENEQLVNFLSVGYDFLDVLGVELKEGRNFSPEFPNDTADGIILNEKAVQDLGVPSPVVGQQIVWAEEEDTTYYATVVGVAKDFHFTSLRSEIKPFAFVVTPQRFGSLAVKINTTNLEATLKQIEKTWDQHVPERMFDYYLLDDSIEALYRSDQNFRTVFSCFTILAIIIACLGLFGLVAFAAEQRTKEIGIRKVLGATITDIMNLLSKDFLLLVLIASVISFPIAWWAMNKWLQGFTYRIDMQWWIFIVAAIAALLIAWLTVSFQAIKAAIVNPVKSLRAE